MTWIETLCEWSKTETQFSGSNQLRFHGFNVDKTIISSCTEATDVTTLSADSSAEFISLNWSDATCFEEVLVVAKENTLVTATPTGDGSSY